MKDWKKDSAGDILVFPVLGWETATFANGMAGGLRITYAKEISLSQNDSIQVLLAFEQVVQLRRDLEKMEARLAAVLQADKSDKSN